MSSTVEIRSQTIRRTYQALKKGGGAGQNLVASRQLLFADLGAIRGDAHVALSRKTVANGSANGLLRRTSHQPHTEGKIRMHTRELARALIAFADIADFERSQELHLLAAFLERGKNETIASRLKHSKLPTRYPRRLKESLEAIGNGLRAVGAVKLSKDLAELQTLFAGRPGGTVDGFFDEVSAPQESANTGSRPTRSAGAVR